MSWVSPIVRGQPTDESTHVDVDDAASGFSDASKESFKTHSDDSFRWADESDLSDEYNEGVEQLPLAAAISSPAQQPTAAAGLSAVPAVPVVDSPISATPPSTPAVTDVPVSSAPAAVTTADSPVNPSVPAVPSASTTTADSSAVPSISHPSIAESPLLFDSSESPPNAQPANPSSADPPPAHSEHILDSQGFVKPLTGGRPSDPADPPPTDPPDPPSSDPSPTAPSPTDPHSSSGRSRISRRTPAPIPEALAAAALRKSTAPILVSSKPRSSSPMEASFDLKRKTNSPKDGSEKKKKGRN